MCESSYSCISFLLTLNGASDKYTAETASRRVTLFEGKQWCLQDVPQLPAAKRSKKKSTAKAAATAEAAAEAAAAGDDIYIVPEDFDAAVLGQPDFSSMADAERTLADLFVKRWWDLREQVGLWKLFEVATGSVT